VPQIIDNADVDVKVNVASIFVFMPQRYR